MALKDGQVLNSRYQIVRLLGQGGFGAVYQAWDLNLKVPCAVKENFETSPSAMRQFEREASMLAMLRHPNLPRVTDHFFIEGQGQYLVMDYIEGEDLRTILEREKKPLPEKQVTGWLVDICDALSYLHAQPVPVIHRDIKPANIKITSDGKAMLVDFGIAKAYSPESRTTQGARALTPGYSPFEQYGQAPTDARSDIYALGATAYDVLTGQAPPESIARMAGTRAASAALAQPGYFSPDGSRHFEGAGGFAGKTLSKRSGVQTGACREAKCGKNFPGQPGLPQCKRTDLTCHPGCSGGRDHLRSARQAETRINTTSCQPGQAVWDWSWHRDLDPGGVGCLGRISISARFYPDHSQFDAHQYPCRPAGSRADPPPAYRHSSHTPASTHPSRRTACPDRAAKTSL